VEERDSGGLPFLPQRGPSQGHVSPSIQGDPIPQPRRQGGLYRECAASGSTILV